MKEISPFVIELAEGNKVIYKKALPNTILCMTNMSMNIKMFKDND